MQTTAFGWIHTYEDYLNIFALNEDDLNKNIIIFPAGVGNFNAHFKKPNIVSADEYYQMAPMEVDQYVDARLNRLKEKLKELGVTGKDRDEIYEKAQKATIDFKKDFPQGKLKGRYQAMQLPQLPVKNQKYDIALCPRCPLQHRDKNHNKALSIITELCRVAHDVRIFISVSDEDSFKHSLGPLLLQLQNKDSFVISGRGELMLEILLTQMRREGFEMTVSPPKVLFQKDKSGKKLEPIEEITMDLDEEHSSRVIDSMNKRKGKLIDLKDTGKDKKRLIFHAPTRGLMGYTSRFLTLTKGTGVINRIFHSYGEYTGDMEGRRNGALISMEKGKAVAFAIFNLQARGEMFVTHNDPVYEGMIVGLSSKSGDLEINVMKGKKLTNMRTQGTDENVVLTPVRKMAIAEQLSMLNTDEALEITPKSCRLRKAILNPHDRKKQSKAS